MSIDKTLHDARAALSGIQDGDSVAVGGFGASGLPTTLVEALLDLGPRDLHIISNNCGADGFGLSRLIEENRVAKFTLSYLGQNQTAARRYLSGDLEVEFVPQGTLAERLRAGGAGVPAFYSPTGRGTMIEFGGLPRRYTSDGDVALESRPRRTETFNGERFLLEEAIVPDFGLVHAHRGDRWGNLRFRVTARNFNPVIAMAARTTIAEVQELLPLSSTSGDDVHLPGVFVDRVVPVADEGEAVDPVPSSAGVRT